MPTRNSLRYDQRSFVFVLTVLTGSNAIVFGSNQLTIRDIAREGFALDFISIAVETAVAYFMDG